MFITDTAAVHVSKRIGLYTRNTAGNDEDLTAYKSGLQSDKRSPPFCTTYLHIYYLLHARIACKLHAEMHPSLYITKRSKVKLQLGVTFVWLTNSIALCWIYATCRKYYIPLSVYTTDLRTYVVEYTVWFAILIGFVVRCAHGCNSDVVLNVFIKLNITYFIPRRV